MKKTIAFIILLLIVSAQNNLLAQPNLVLSRPGKSHHFFYHVGDKIAYQDNSSGYKHSGVIYIMTDSTIELDRAPRINIKDISVVYRTRHFIAQAAGSGIVVLGVYFPISVLNRAFQHEQPIIDKDLLIVNGTMLAVSGIALLFVKRKCRIDKPWKLQVLDFGHPVYN